MFPSDSFRMHDQVRDRVRLLMGERTPDTPPDTGPGALLGAVGLVAVLCLASVLAGMPPP